MMIADKILTSSEKFHISLGLDRISKIMAILNNPQDDLKFIHVAGTNGKGSTCAFLNEILIENGIMTGLFTSPHLFSYTERIKANNKEISEKDFDRLVLKIDNLAREHDIQLSEFEIITAVAFCYFKEKNVDVVVLETGLGGRLDSTNVIKSPLVAIITTIDFDHKERLGNTIEKIAAEKAGIIKGDCPVIVRRDNLGFDTILKHTKNLIIADDIKNDIKIGLLGNHQKQNLSLALAAIKHLPFKFDEKKVLNAIKNTKWAFRMEYHKSCNILLDGCHNPNGARVLRDFLDENFTSCRFVFGCLKNKEYEKMLEILLHDDDEFYFNEFSHANSLKFDELGEKFRARAKKYNGETFNDGGLTIYCGSLYMLGEMFKSKLKSTFK